MKYMLYTWLCVSLVMVAFIEGKQYGENKIEKVFMRNIGKRLHLLPSSKDFETFKTCKITYLGGQALITKNVVFVLLENCDWMVLNPREAFIFETTELEPFDEN